VLDPRVFGAGRDDLVTLAVIVILFEGGLGLDLARLRHQQRALLLLLTLGAAITFVGATAAAHWIGDLPAELAALYGALMVVTGPTVVTPLLARLRLDRRVREILVSEGVLIDPIGAIFALVVAEWAVGRADLIESAPTVALRLTLGAGIGAAAGLLLARALRKRWLPEHLVSPAALAVALLSATCANALSSEAGLMAGVAAGVALGNSGVPDLGRLRDFKETLTLILLSFVFVLLAADLSLRDIEALGARGVLVVAALLWVCRPLAVFASTVGSGLSLSERLFMSWICPRGIVAAAVAGLFAILLDEAGVDGGRELLALVFLTVAVSVTLQGLSAKAVARRLGLDFPNLRTTVIVGADRIGRVLAALLVSQQREAVLLDRSPWLARSARRAGLQLCVADALTIDGLAEAGAARADSLVALTRNAELNALVAQRARENFRIERLLAWTDAGGEANPSNAPLRPFPGRFPGMDEVNGALQREQLELVEFVVGEGDASGARVGELPFAEREFALLIRRGSAVLVASGEHALAPGDVLWCLRPAGTTSELDRLMQARTLPMP
jgi:NhaP-type Na+/H+ or K+/H+ antiporter